MCRGLQRDGGFSCLYPDSLDCMKKTEVLSSHNFYPVTSHKNLLRGKEPSPILARASHFFHRLEIPPECLDKGVCETEECVNYLTALPQKGTPSGN